MKKIDYIYDGLKALAEKKKVEMPNELIFIQAIGLRVAMKDDMEKFFVDFRKKSNKPISPRDPTAPASDAQKKFIKDKIDKELDMTDLSSGDAHFMISEHIAKSNSVNKEEVKDEAPKEESPVDSAPEKEENSAPEKPTDPSELPDY